MELNKTMLQFDAIFANIEISLKMINMACCSFISIQILFFCSSNYKSWVLTIGKTKEEFEFSHQFMRSFLFYGFIV